MKATDRKKKMLNHGITVASGLATSRIDSALGKIENSWLRQP